MPVHRRWDAAPDTGVPEARPGQDLRPHHKLTCRDESSQPVGVLRPYLKVVIDRGHLTVKGEAELRLPLGVLEHLVEQVDQPHPEPLEGLVSLPIPVRVRDEVNRLAALDAHSTSRHLAPRLAALDAHSTPSGPVTTVQ